MSKTYSQKEIIQQFKNIHGDKYDYSKVIYKGIDIKICIICPKHGEFWQTPSSHKNGHGCKYCYFEKDSFQKTKLVEQFIIESKRIHGDKYDYSKSIYINGNTKVCVICSKHGEFWVRPDNHIFRKSGCLGCRFSRGEALIRHWLGKKNIKFISQYRFEKCKGKRNRLPFDFYLPDLNICIEYNGRQHYDKESKYYSEELNQHDKIKAQYCLDNNIKLIIIPYWENIYLALSSLNLHKAEFNVL